MTGAQSTRGWSPDREIWEALHELSQPLDWQCVPVDRKRRLRIPSKPGIYFFSGGPPKFPVPTPTTVLYVGKSDISLRSRFSQHVAVFAGDSGNPRLREYLVVYFPRTSFWYAVVAEKRRRSNLEGLLFRAFRPPCNRITPPGTKGLLAGLGSRMPLSGQTRLRYPA